MYHLQSFVRKNKKSPILITKKIIYTLNVISNGSDIGNRLFLNSINFMHTQYYSKKRAE